jgi:hypothetical protein
MCAVFEIFHDIENEKSNQNRRKAKVDERLIANGFKFFESFVQRFINKSNQQQKLSQRKYDLRQFGVTLQSEFEIDVSINGLN